MYLLIFIEKIEKIEKIGGDRGFKKVMDNRDED